MSLDAQLSHLQDSAEMLNLILGQIALQIILSVEHTNLVIGLWPLVLGLSMV